MFAEIRHYEAVAAGRPSRGPVEELGPPTPEAEEFFKELEEAQRLVTAADLQEFEREQERIDAYDLH